MEQSTAQSMRAVKQYAVGTTNKSRTKAFATPVNSRGLAFDFDLSWGVKDIKTTRKSHSVVMRPQTTSSSSDTPIMGVSDIDLKSLSSPIHLCFGDPDTSPKVTWESMPCKSKLMTNIFELNIDLGNDIGRKVFEWKRTHKVGEVQRWNIDFLNLKMVEKESGKVVASFVHHLWYGKKRGYFHIEEFDGGEGWDKVVLLSGMSVLEYMRKMTGWSW